MNLKHALAPLLFAVLASVANAAPSTPTFADDPAALEFARDLEQRHGFSADELLAQFAQTRSNPRVLELIKPLRKAVVEE